MIIDKENMFFDNEVLSTTTKELNIHANGDAYVQPFLVISLDRAATGTVGFKLEADTDTLISLAASMPSSPNVFIGRIPQGMKTPLKLTMSGTEAVAKINAFITFGVPFDRGV